MSQYKYPHLFEPLELGNILIKNRIEAAPTGLLASTAHGFPTQHIVDYFANKAKGGASIVTAAGGLYGDMHGIEYMGTEESSHNFDIISSMSLISSAIRRHGAVASFELHHPGMYAPDAIMRGLPAYGPVEMPVGGTNTNDEIKGYLSTPMTEDTIWHFVDLWANNAALLKAAGFQMVMIHGGHGWQMSQFMSPVINTRTDKWGGASLENRMRFPLAVCKAIKEKCGEDFLIDFRMSGDEVHPNGYDIREGIKIAKMLDGQVDLIHVSTGHHEIYKAFVDTHPSMFMPDGVNLHYAAEIKKHVKTPVVTVGAFNDPAHMEQVLASGQADIIAVARGIIADPFMPKKAQAGCSEDINQCLRCMTCFSNHINTHYFTCAINPRVGREGENKFELSIPKSQKVLVSGGGIAGMQAALTAARRGHQVTLCEKKNQLGGVLRCEDKVDFKQKLKKYIDNQIRRVNLSPAIDVRLNCAVDLDFINAESPDTLVIAVGSQAVVPTWIPGFDRHNVISAEDAYRDSDALDEHVVIIGGGLVGCELGIYLDSLGHQVTILEMTSAIGYGENTLQGQAIEVKIAQTGIDLKLNAKVVEINTDGVTADVGDSTMSIRADNVVYAVGYQPQHEEVIRLSSCGVSEIYRFGDCIKASTICNANQDAYYGACDIGVYE